MTIEYVHARHNAAAINPATKGRPMSKHEQTIEEHVDSGLRMALDQVDCYENPAECMASYSLNVQDSCLADGYSADDAANARNWFINKFEKTA